MSLTGAGVVRRADRKVLPIHELARDLEATRGKAQVALCHGVFDLLHVGHLRHLREAKALADVLVVTVTPDRFVNKGPGRPAFPQDLRAEMLAALDCVDYVAVNEWPTAVETLRLLRPDLYVKGPDYRDRAADLTGKIDEEEAAARETGGRLVITDDVTFSSSSLINRYLPAHSGDVRAYLEAFRSRRRVEEVLGYLDAARSLRVLVLGEAIVDEYQYVSVLGMASKEPVIVGHYRATDTFAGGSLAVANHLAEFAGEVELVTCVGRDGPYEAFAREKLKPNVVSRFVRTSAAPTIVKRRFVEQYLVQKMFEVYEMDDHGIRPEEHEAVRAELERAMPRCDLVVAVDYGHGLIDAETVRLVAREAPFLALNVQANAGNRGYNSLSKYPRADYVSIAQHEAFLELRNTRLTPQDTVSELKRRVPCGTLAMTRGKDGILAHRDGEGFSEAPALAHRVVDRVGAGDAVLSLTSLCAVQKAPLDVVCFVGNVAGAEAVQIVGNKDSVRRVPLSKHIATLMK